MSTTIATGLPKESRTERRRRETRQRLVDAAEGLMSSGPIDEIQIKHITEAADVGHGTFYVHFKSKYEILLPIVQRRAARWDQLIQAALPRDDDPAHVMVWSGRQMSRLMQADPVWQWLLSESGMPAADIKAAIGAYTARDMERGIASGRFTIPDVNVANEFMFGAYVNTLLASFTAEDPGHMIDTMMELMMRVLGVDPAEAAQLAHEAFEPLTP